MYIVWGANSYIVTPDAIPAWTSLQLGPIYSVRAGDTLTTVWEVIDKDDKPKHGGGVVRMRADCVNQQGVRVAEANGAMLVGNALAA